MSPLKTGVLILALSLVAACGRQIVEFQNGGEGSDVDANTNPSGPSVLFTVPANNAMSVARDTAITATFNKAMNASTINALTFTVKQGLTPVTGAVTFDAPTNTATFVPAAGLGNTMVYTGTITVGAKDTGGVALAADYVWTFTTGAMINMMPPRVILTNPLNLATNVSSNKRPTATFNKAMNSATLTALTFTLRQGLTPVPGTVTYDAATNTAKLSPTNPLAISTTYTATITTGAQDLGGLGLVADYTWSFTTGACTLAPIDPRSAGNFAVLAGAGVTNTGMTVVTGDLGVWPGTSVSGFPPGTVVGTQHINDPTAMAGIADLTLAYDDAMSRTLCAMTVAGNIGGQTLTPGLYKSTSSLAISMGDLTLDAQGDADAVFIFDVPTGLTTTTGRKITLTNGANAGNIYWRVGSSATLGTNSVFEGTIMANSSITITTGATLDGRALATNGTITLDFNPITKP